jgi:hypothetical protein
MRKTKPNKSIILSPNRYAKVRSEEENGEENFFFSEVATVGYS